MYPCYANLISEGPKAISSKFEGINTKNKTKISVKRLKSFILLEW